MDLTTLERVRRMVAGDSSTKTSSGADAATLSLLISDASAEFESYLGRTIQIGNYTETFGVWEGRTAFPVMGFPIASVTSVKNDIYGQYSGLEMTIPSLYVTNTAQVVVVNYPLSPGANALRIAYSGGLVANTEALIAHPKYRALALACDLHVNFLYRRRNSLDMTSQSIQGDVTTFSQMRFLPEVQKILDLYRSKAL